MPLDPAQFRALFEAERDHVHRFLQRLCGNAADADDLTQEAFLVAWRHRAAFAGRGSVVGWLLKTAYRLYLDAQRRRARRHGLDQRLATGSAAGAPSLARADGAASPAERPPGASDDPERRDARAFVLDRVRAAVAALPDGPREAFVLFRLEGLPVAEIAALTDTPLKTVETRIRRATQLLAERLGALHQHLPIA